VTQTAECVIRDATPEDAAIVGRHRVGMFRDMRHVVAGAGVQIRTIVPRPGPGGAVFVGPQALVLNVHAEPGWRRRGIAEALMRAVLACADAAAMSSVVLHASDAGRGLYERLGFRPTNEMIYHGAPVTLARTTSTL